MIITPKVFQPTIHDDVKTIQHQQHVTKYILDAFHDMGISAVLAGGAPRNWHLGFPAKDLDFYINVSDYNINSFEERFKSHIYRSMVKHYSSCGKDMMSPISVLWVRDIPKEAIPIHYTLWQVLNNKEELLNDHAINSRARIAKMFMTRDFRIDGALMYAKYLTKSNVLAALECVIDSVPCQIMWYSNDNECLAIDDRIKRVLENFDCSVCCTSVTKQGDIYVQRVFEEFNISIAQRSLHILGYVSCNNHVLNIQNYPVFRPYKVENVVEEKWELDYFVEYPI